MQKKMMKMITKSEKNNILSKVSEVLKQCQDLVLSLSSFEVIDDCVKIQSKMSNIVQDITNSEFDKIAHGGSEGDGDSLDGSEGDEDALDGSKGYGDALAGGEDDADALADGEDDADALASGEDDADALVSGEDDGDALAGSEDDGDADGDALAGSDDEFQVQESEEDVENVAVINAVDIDPLEDVAIVPKNEQMTADVNVTELPTTKAITSVMSSGQHQTSVNGVSIQNGLAAQINVKDSTDVDMSDDNSEKFVLMYPVLQFLDVAAPNAIYRPNWRQEETKKLIHPMFYNLWINCDSIFKDVPQEVPPAVSIPQIQYPSVDWSLVHVRNLANIPTPITLAVHGCSADPSHYEKELVQGYNCKEWRPSRFEQNYPFGHLPGYITDMGPIAFSSQIVFGHVWSVDDHKWILHASLSQKEDSRRKPGGRRQGGK